jgi:CDP-diacylglycerol--glycerol-3-phosphate 3-phosphatidyltransferase
MVDMGNTKDWLRNLPNKLTLARIAAIPLLLAVYPAAVALDSAFLAALFAVTFAVAAVTDLVDGYLARKYGNVTPLGALLDPIADKMLVAASLVLLASSKAVPSFLAALLICRDIGVNGIRLLALEQQITVQVNDLGKWKTTILSVAIFCLFVYKRLWGLPFTEVGMVGMWVGLGLSLYSAWTYGRGFLQKSKVSFYT